MAYVLLVGIIGYVAVFFYSVFFSVRFQFGKESNDERGKNILNTSYGLAFPFFILGWFFLFLFDEYFASLSLEGYKMAVWFILTGGYIIHAASLFYLRRVS